MKNYRKHIDDFFREKLGAYSETPPPEVWDDLEKRLDGLVPGTTGTAPYRWLWHFTIVSLLLVLGISVGRKVSNNAGNRAIALNSSSAAGTGGNQNGTNANPAAAQAGNGITSNNTGNNNMPAATGNTNPANNGQNITNNTTSNNATSNNNTAHSNTSTQRTASNKKHPASFGTKGQAAASNNNYNSSYAATGSKRGPAGEENGDDRQANTNPNAGATNNKQVPAEAQAASTQKKTAIQPAKTNTAKKETEKYSPIGFNRFEAGIKAGYEGGFTGGAASKYVISPYVQYNMSPTLAIMVQPAVKYATVSNTSIGSPQSYYAIDPETSTLATNDIPVTETHGAMVDTIHTTTYTYTQKHDSIVKSNTFGGSYAEYELPVLLKYSISKKVSVYGGVNLVYSKLMAVTEHTYTQTGILKTMDTTIVTVNGTPQPPKGVGITYTGNVYNPNQGPAYPGAPANQFHVGYMVGFSYAWSRKWMFDALVEQTPTAPDMKGGYNINTPLSSAYFRLSIGYKITK